MDKAKAAFHTLENELFKQIGNIKTSNKGMKEDELDELKVELVSKLAELTSMMYRTFSFSNTKNDLNTINGKPAAFISGEEKVMSSQGNLLFAQTYAKMNHFFNFNLAVCR